LFRLLVAAGSSRLGPLPLQLTLLAVDTVEISCCEFLLEERSPPDIPPPLPLATRRLCFRYPFFSIFFFKVHISLRALSPSGAFYGDVFYTPFAISYHVNRCVSPHERHLEVPLTTPLDKCDDVSPSLVIISPPAVWLSHPPSFNFPLLIRHVDPSLLLPLLQWRVCLPPALTSTVSPPSSGFYPPTLAVTPPPLSVRVLFSSFQQDYEEPLIAHAKATSETVLASLPRTIFYCPRFSGLFSPPELPSPLRLTPKGLSSLSPFRSCSHLSVRGRPCSGSVLFSCLSLFTATISCDPVARPRRVNDISSLFSSPPTFIARHDERSPFAMKPSRTGNNIPLNTFFFRFSFSYCPFDLKRPRYKVESRFPRLFLPLLTGDSEQAPSYSLRFGSSRCAHFYKPLLPPQTP